MPFRGLVTALMTKDAYTLPRIDVSLRLLGNQQWFSTMDLTSGYWQVAMSPEVKGEGGIRYERGVVPIPGDAVWSVQRPSHV